MSMLRLYDRLLGRYRIDAQVAEGGMGVVYRGLDLEIDQTIAIKVLRPEAIDNVGRFEREATILATLQHPGVLRYIAHGVAHEGSPFLVTEWIAGTTLADQAAIGLGPADSVAIAARVAEALGAAHARGLVHRDVKPDNILLTGGDLLRPKVIDFGLVRRMAGDHRLTETGVVVGTPGYMAPEQARGEREIDPRTDVFALGCVLYECLTGVPAFPGRNAAAVMARIVLCEPPALREVWPDAPPALDRLVARMMAKLRDDRPRDGAALAAELRAITAPAQPVRRRAETDDTATAVGRPRAASHVIFVQAAEVTAELEPLVAPLGARAHQLADGTIVIVVEDDAAAAADLAIALARSLGSAPIVLAGPHEAGAPLAQLLEDGAGALELADLQQIFGGPAPPGSIRVDPTTAARLDGQFDVREDRGALYLIGRNAS